MTKTVAYIRVSSTDQADNGHSLGVQREKVELYAKLHGLELVAVIEDAGASAKTLDRPGLNRALAMLDQGEAGALLIGLLLATAAVAVVERFNTALSSEDLATVGSLLAADVLILESGGAERSREEYLGHHAVSDAAFLKGAHRQLLRQRARTAGEFAWVGTESELHAQKDGKPLTVQSTETMVLKQTADGWRIVHIHWSSRTQR